MELFVPFSIFTRLGLTLSHHPFAQFTPSKRRRLSKGDRRPPDNNEFLPDDPSSQDENLGCLDFHEELNEEVLSLKFTVVNRAPVMTAWATVVAEKLGFKRDEALSIGELSCPDVSVVTEPLPLHSFRVHGDERCFERHFARTL